MPLKVIRTRIKTTDVVLAATSIASIIASVGDMASFPPVRAAATVVLVILQTVQEMDSNRTSCYKLARRAAKLLSDLKQRMEGRWDSAPRALLDNISSFEQTLISIRDFMLELAKLKWMGRLLQKGAIEGSLGDFHDLLDEAERSFQIASLIEIHYTVGILQQRSAGADVHFVENVIDDNEADERPPLPSLPIAPNGETIPYVMTTGEMTGLTSADMSIVQSFQSLSVSEQMPIVKNTLAEGEITAFEQQLDEELLELDRLGFKRYHQSDVRLQSTLKGMGPESFWEGSSIADVDGRRAIVKRYDSGKNDERAMKRWLHDIKTLGNIYHVNLPQLVGYSDEKSPTPFILLSQVKLRDPIAFLSAALQSKSIAECTNIVIRMYRDITSAALYVQRQLSLDEQETQVFVAEASYSLDAASGNMILGIPPPKDPNTFHGFGYRLTESLVGRVLQSLPKPDNFQSLAGTSEAFRLVELRNKLVHVRALTLNLLPKAGHPPDLAAFVEELLDDDTEDSGTPQPSRSLSRIRLRNIEAGVHDIAWHKGIHSCPVSFSVGDIGFISHEYDHVDISDESRFDGFIKIGNVFDEESDIRMVKNVTGFNIVRDVTGKQGQWVNGFHKNFETFPFVLPDSIEGWSICLPPQGEMEVHVRHSASVASVNEAWRYLLREAENLARLSKVEAHRIIIITKTTIGQIYKVRDLSPPPLRPFGNHSNRSFHSAGNHFGGFGPGQQSAFGVPGFGGPFYQDQPRMMYLFTSYRPGFRSFWADNPSAAAMPEEMRKNIQPRSVGSSVAWAKPEAFIEYIQLSEEDFMS